MQENKHSEILLILTGGTICSFENDNGEREPDIKKAEHVIISNFKKSNSPYKEISFDKKQPLNILSENQTLETLSVLLNEFKNEEEINKYKGVIVLHGTDTLSFTSALLSLTLAHIKVPIILVSAKLPLTHKDTNGNVNFKAAVELIMNGIKPNVYAVYQNDDKKTYLHLGSQLQKCENFSNDFLSLHQKEIENESNAKESGVTPVKKDNILKKIDHLESGVLLIYPYSALDYSHYNLQNVKCVIHGTYHSETVCTKGENTSIIDFVGKCKNRDIPIFISPLSNAAYVSTANALDSGIIPLGNITTEAAYMKAVVGISLGYSKEKLTEFLINK